MDIEVDHLLKSSLASNTSQAYAVGHKAFETFCNSQGVTQVWPPDLQQIIRFLGYLSVKGYSSSTACNYISAISFKCKTQFFVDPTKAYIVSKLLEGFRRTQPTSDQRRPITTEILNKIIPSLQTICNSKYEACLFAAACSLAFYALLRVGEFSLTKGNTTASLLAITDINISQNMLEITVRSSKTDQYAKGCTRTILATQGVSCPVKRIQEFLEIRPAIPGPLFCHFSGRPLTSFQFASVLNKAIRSIGLNPDYYKTHSFRIGGASCAAAIGESSENIKHAGRWNSNCYKSYIRPCSNNQN